MAELICRTASSKGASVLSIVLAPLAEVSFAIAASAAVNLPLTIVSNPATSGLEAQIVGCDPDWARAVTLTARARTKICGATKDIRNLGSNKVKTNGLKNGQPRFWSRTAGKVNLPVNRGMPGLHSVRSMLAIVLLAGINGDGQAVFFRRERTRGVRCDRARRVVSTIEVEHNFAVRDRIGVKESAPGISFRLARQIADHEAQSMLGVAAERCEREFPAVEFKMDFTRTGRGRDVAEHVRNINNFRSIRWNKTGSHSVVQIEWKKHRPIVVADSIAVQIAHSNADAGTARNHEHAQAAQFDHGRLARDVALQCGFAYDFILDLGWSAGLKLGRHIRVFQHE